MGDGVAPVRPMSLSQHSGVDTTLRDSFYFDTKYIRSPATLVDPKSMDEGFVSTVMTWLKKSTNESQLQQGLFNSMARLSTITVPAESKRLPKENERTFFSKLVNAMYPASYQEKDMRSLLDSYATDHLSSLVGDESLEKMKGVQPGLFLRATSRPDFCVIVQDATDSDGADIAIGEVKNDDKYSVRDAVTQTGAYLMLLLYWWRAVVGRDVSSVHGFTVGGPYCRDLKQRKRKRCGSSKCQAQYSVCLLELSASKDLGGIPCLTCFQETCSLNDDSAARHLCQFLMNGPMWGQKTTTVIPNPCPAFFSAQANFASKLPGKNWTLVQNGTTALIFQCHGKQGVIKVLKMANDQIRSKCSQVWSTYLDEQENKGDSGQPTFYVKVVTAATDPNFMSVLYDLRGDAKRLNDEDFLRTYPVYPIRGHRCYFLLMAHRGARIDTSLSWKGDELNKMFHRLWTQTTALSEMAWLQHGDIARHNILLEHDVNDGDRRLVLIDWDEARLHPKSRVSQGDEYLRLQHPELLRGEPLLYTKVQLALLYWDLV